MSKRKPYRSPAIATRASTLIVGDSAEATTAPISTSTSMACYWTFPAGSVGSLESVAQMGAEVAADHRILERQIDNRGQPPERCARVVAPSVAEHPVKGSVDRLDAQGIGQLNLATGSRLHPLQLLEDVGREDIATDDDEIARGIVHCRFLDQRAHADDTVSAEIARRVDDAVGADLIPWHPFQPDDTPACALAQARHLVEQTRVAHQLVRKENGERLGADSLRRAADRVAETERLVLIHEADANVSAD